MLVQTNTPMNDCEEKVAHVPEYEINSSGGVGDNVVVVLGHLNASNGENTVYQIVERNDKKQLLVDFWREQIHNQARMDKDLVAIVD